MDAQRYEYFARKIHDGEYICEPCPQRKGYYWVRRGFTNIRYLGPIQYKRLQALIAQQQQTA